MAKFNKKQTKMFSEIYRMLNYFHHDESQPLDQKLLIVLYPSQVKSIKDYIKLSFRLVPTPRETDWYMLSDKGKELFSKHLNKHKLSDEENLALLKGTKLINFNI